MKVEVEVEAEGGGERSIGVEERERCRWRWWTVVIISKKNHDQRWMGICTTWKDGRTEGWCVPEPILLMVLALEEDVRGCGVQFACVYIAVVVVVGIRTVLSSCGQEGVVAVRRSGCYLISYANEISSTMGRGGLSTRGSREGSKWAVYDGLLPWGRSRSYRHRLNLPSHTHVSDETQND